MDYDIDPCLIKDIYHRAHKYRKVHLLCSKPGAIPIELGLHAGERFSGEHEKYTVTTVQNAWFGGSIMAAGLLLVPDFLAAATEVGLCEAIFVPAVAFDRAGRDLAGNSYLQLEEHTGCKVEII